MRIAGNIEWWPESGAAATLGIDLLDQQEETFEEVTVPFTDNALEQMNLLLQFDSSTLTKGVKVHSSARQEVVSACEALFHQGLVSQSDGGYLTDAGVETLVHVQALAGLLGLNSPDC